MTTYLRAWFPSRFIELLRIYDTPEFEPYYMPSAEYRGSIYHKHVLKYVNCEILLWQFSCLLLHYDFL